jgi:pimeloyl-ACP methyl ester carboxylesterase
MSAANPLRPVVLFIHGFGSSSACWKPMLKLLSEDECLNARYEFATWDYPTKWVELNLLGRLPRLQEISRGLRGVIDSRLYHQREVTLVGHSQGGLVIQSYFADLIEKGEADRLRHIRQAILLATPCGGSTTAMSLRLMLSSIAHNPQELTLRVLNPEVADIRECVRERVVGATRDGPNQWRVPIHALCGMQDKIVPEASARGVFDSVRSIPGTHLSIHKPTDKKDDRYIQFASLLLDPGGHSHRFEVESYENIFRVEPRPSQEIWTSAKDNPRKVVFDNYAISTRTVRFAASNRCRDVFTISYDTNPDAYVIGHPSHPNEASAADKGRSEEKGTFYRFDFTPEREEVYSLSLEIYNGFKEDQRHVHFHPGSYNSRVRKLVYQLDLSAYLSAGYIIPMPPRCYRQRRDVEHSELCRQRTAEAQVESVVVAGEGVYCWELNDIERGVVDIVWQVARTSGPPAVGPSENGAK